MSTLALFTDDTDPDRLLVAARVDVAVTCCPMERVDASVNVSGSYADPREEHFLIQGPHPGRSVFLALFCRLLTVWLADSTLAVLYVHGATFPSSVSVAHRFDGYSWRDALNAAGFDVWGLDFQGFGHSDRYPEMNEPADAHAPLCDAKDLVRRLKCAVGFSFSGTRASLIQLISHSWGSMAVSRIPCASPNGRPLGLIQTHHSGSLDVVRPLHPARSGFGEPHVGHGCRLTEQICRGRAGVSAAGPDA